MAKPGIAPALEPILAEKAPAEPGRHRLDRRRGERAGEMARARAAAGSEAEAPSGPAMALFRQAGRT